MITFHTPQLPKPLNLDLASLDGGGACPSQFQGITHDGKTIHARYRGGRITVDIGEKQNNRLEEKDRILEADIGPYLDGSMSRAQFCTYLGVTVNGKVPDEGDPTAHHNKDLSGNTTFWVAHMEWVTLETSRKLVAALHAALPHSLLIVPVVDERFRLKGLKSVDAMTLADTQCWLIEGASDVGEIETSPKDYLLPNKAQLQIHIDFALWRYPNPRYSGRHLKRISEEIQKSLIVAGSTNMPEEEALAIDTLNLRAEFNSADNGRRGQLEQLGDVIRSFLPETLINRVNLKTGEILSQMSIPLDPVLHAWCGKEKDHWLYVSRAGQDQPWTGLKPA